ncbi:uncharacterized protein LOC129598463 [Paramacrobiotus metropolitanus]|uniref:uncharacterized protein LOC129598463 n=1 Tax=Paramacrobiotus metropolitanus TaxID=2943436 RepID=UPI00244577E9|nr:uncharacterized protein LOC129598463 [Paramacrobiotus metropolitanus]
MEALMSLLSSQGGKLVIAAVNAILDKTSPGSSAVRGKFVDYYFLFDTRDELLKVHKSITEANKKLQESFKKETQKIMTATQHQDISMKVCRIWNNFDNFITARDSQSQERRKQIFLADNADCVLAEYHKVITTSNVTSRFLDDLIETHEYIAFQEWCDVLLTNSLLVYWCAKYQLRLEAEPGDLMATLQVPEHKLDSQLEDIVNAVKSAKSRYHRKSFSSGQTENQLNADKDTSEFVKMVDDFMVNSYDESSTANQRLANDLGKQLKDKYPWLIWAVVIAEDNRDWRNFISYSSDVEEHLLLQTSTHKHRVPLLNNMIQPDLFHKTVSSGHRYGIFTCKRKFDIAGKLLHQRRITIFWINREDIVEVHLMNADKNGLRNLNIKKLAEDFGCSTAEKTLQIKERNQHQTEQHRFIEDALYRNGYHYVAYMGLRISRDADVTGMYLSNHGVSPSWPYHVQNKSGHLLLWVTNVTQGAINRMRVVSEMCLAEELLRCGIDFRVAQGKIKTTKAQSLPDIDVETLLMMAKKSVDKGNKHLAMDAIAQATNEYEYANALLDHSIIKSCGDRIPLLVTAGSNLALSYLKLRNVQAAQESANAVLQNSRHSAEALMIRCLTHLSCRKYAESEQDMCRSLKLQPSKHLETVLKMIQLGTMNGGNEIPQRNRSAKDTEICSTLSKLILDLSLTLHSATEAEPEREDLKELRNTLSAFNTLVYDVQEKLQPKNGPVRVCLLIGWLDAVLHVAKHMEQLRAKGVLLRRENVEMELLKLKVLTAGKDIFLEPGDIQKIRKHETTITRPLPPLPK